MENDVPLRVQRVTSDRCSDLTIGVRIAIHGIANVPDGPVILGRLEVPLSYRE